MSKILYVASNMRHINNFHSPYIEGLRADGHTVQVMATGEGAENLVARLEELATAGKKEYIFEIPSHKFALINLLYSDATVLDTEYTENGARVTAVCDKKTAGKLSAYISKD